MMLVPQLSNCTSATTSGVAAVRSATTLEPNMKSHQPVLR